MKRLLVLLLLAREWWLAGQLDVIEEQIELAPQRRRLLADQLRKIRGEIARLTPASTLLAQALKRRNA